MEVTIYFFCSQALKQLLISGCIVEVTQVFSTVRMKLAALRRVPLVAGVITWNTWLQQ
jgi:hypothetical protein